MSNFYRATVRAIVGDRFISEFMASADLGLSGVGNSKLFTIDYKEGESVDEDRVRIAMDKMIDASEREQTKFKILSYRILGFEKVKN